MSSTSRDLWVSRWYVDRLWTLREKLLKLLFILNIAYSVYERAYTIITAKSIQQQYVVREEPLIIYSILYCAVDSNRNSRLFFFIRGRDSIRIYFKWYVLENFQNVWVGNTPMPTVTCKKINNAIMGCCYGWPICSGVSIQPCAI